MRQSIQLVVIALAVLAVQQWIQAESRLGDGYAPLPDPLEAKDIAKAKFGMSLQAADSVAKAKLAVVREEYEARRSEFLSGRGSLDFFESCSRRWLEAELAVADTPAAVVAAYDRHWAMMLEIEVINKARYDAGRIPVHDYLESKYYRLDAEHRLLQAQAKLPKK
jgi:hypothetical protein